MPGTALRIVGKFSVELSRSTAIIAPQCSSSSSSPGELASLQSGGVSVAVFVDGNMDLPTKGVKGQAQKVSADTVTSKSIAQI